MDKENKSFSDVLHKAKKLGYAESNPSSDLNGDDVSAKLKILSSLCFNSFLNNNIHVEYLDLRSLITLEESSDKLKRCGIFIACYIDGIRLIDNIEI